MSFHEVRFPASLSFGSVGGPERRTEIVTLANGFEERNSPWLHSRRRYDAGLGMRSLDDVETMVAFFEARRGPLYGFRWKDWGDYRSGTVSQEPDAGDQLLGIGDGETDLFQLTKTYWSGDENYVRPIRKPVEETVRLALQGQPLLRGVHFELDAVSGEVRFYDPPGQDAQITAGFEFDVPVRFDTDSIRTSVASFRAGDVPSVPVLEVRA